MQSEGSKCIVVLLPSELQEEILALIINRRKNPESSDRLLEASPREEARKGPYEEQRRGRQRGKPLEKALPRICDLIALSSTCSFFRQLLAPKIFHTVFLSNSEKSAKSLQAIAAGSHRSYVKVLRYCGFPFQANQTIKDTLGFGTEHSDALDASFRDMFPPALEDVLANLSRFSSLYELSVEFAFSLDDIKDPYDVVDEPFYFEEDSIEPWKRLVSHSFSAICQNEPGLPSLSLLNFQSMDVSSFGFALNPILERLKEFSIVFRGWDNGAGWKLNCNEAFAHSARNLDTYFFDHLHDCETLKLHFDESCPLGMAEVNYSAHAHTLRRHHLPKLRYLEASYLFMDEMFEDFLVGHALILESVRLNQCMCSIEYYDWETLFKGLIAASPESLSVFELESSGIQLWDEFDDVPKEDDAEARAVAQKQAEGGRVFPYATLDDKYGMLFVDCDTNRSAFLSGEDEEKFHQLMSIVSSN